MKKIVSVIGARPQFIKAGAISRKILENTEIEEVLIHTGQHYDSKMSEVFFKELEIPSPKYNLGIGGFSHGAMTGRMIEGIEKILLEEKPNFTLVYGDTDSTLAGALASVKLQIPVIHIEAGLRSFNMQMPEEINRILTDRVSSLLFAPTKRAVENLQREGFENFDCEIVCSGDVMYDVALYYKDRAKKPNMVFPKEFILCTLHRAENTENLQKMKNIFEALNKISSQIPVIMPLHPRTQNKILVNNIQAENIYFIEPLGYLEMVWALQNCVMVATDSGGLQKEAYYFKKPCITLREETEWVELLEVGCNCLVGADTEKIYQAFKKMSDINLNFDALLYGNGNASQKILEVIGDF
ncbi:UDP-N-acetylglucosamine 2-epimerase [Helicobacter pullorum]|uniref:non-hydrolyzing UDP-N-acetylglucosamine 2-epimerase n=1 Tax=Helicobacter pullorum TaxID=35818 RepID=UPI0008169476|nr:UDP-N-acetylglucosamine 2-epimerase (non-hydrolyzing) [Helicobacter pullorum]OCR03559.1 UDP-N-acetylglucosamine 2-epimerase [Helicobacter pullorum]OCR18824.1 UDP-N-acetylglucosamine 2-epimerase [Helicobacter pullorum]